MRAALASLAILCTGLLPGCAKLKEGFQAFGGSSPRRLDSSPDTAALLIVYAPMRHKGSLSLGLGGSISLDRGVLVGADSNTVQSWCSGGRYVGGRPGHRGNLGDSGFTLAPVRPTRARRSATAGGGWRGDSLRIDRAGRSLGTWVLDHIAGGDRLPGTAIVFAQATRGIALMCRSTGCARKG